MSAYPRPQPEPEDGPDFRQALQADAQTLANRGFASNFVGGWLAFWPYVAARYGPQLEEAYWRTFPSKKPKTARQIIASVSRSTMALMSAAVRADKSKSERRRFHCSAWVLESYRAGFELIPDELSAEERKKQRANHGRYWRAHWAVVHLFQNVTGLNLFPRSSRDWRENRESHEAAAYTDNATDLFLDLAGRGARFTPGLSRVARFEFATAAAVESFRKQRGEYAPGYVMPDPPEYDAHVKDFERLEGKHPTEADEAAGSKPARVISFAKAKARMAEGVEALKARAEAGQLTPAEIEEVINLVAPLAVLALDLRESSEGIKHGEPSEDSAENPSAKSPPVSEEPKPVFAGNFEGASPVSADKNIRVKYVPLDVSPGEFLAAFYSDPREDVRLRFFGPKEVPRDVKGIPLDSRFNAAKDVVMLGDFDTSPGQLRKVQAYNKTRGVYFVVNAGGDKAAEITRVNAFFAECDEGTLAEQHAKLDACPLPTSIRVETKKSVHAYWLARADNATLEEFDEIQRRLIHYFKSDPKIKDRSRVMRLPGFNHISYHNNGLLDMKPVVVVQFARSLRYTAAEMLGGLPALPEQPKPKFDVKRAKPAVNLDEHKWELGARISTHESARRNGSGKWDCRAVCHGGKGTTGLFFDPSGPLVWCNSGCDLPTISRAFGLDMPTSAAAPHASDGKERGTI